MASSFGRYQGGIEASTGNLVPAAGQMAAMTANAISGFGQNIAEGIKKYNQNAAENEILDGEAQALSQQIFGFQQMFADPQTGQINPEYAPFANSLTPDIETLAKFNSMSLNQKKGVMTGMKARFANIGQNLSAFEMTKKARLQQDMNMARGGVKEFDEVTVPTAIIPSGKLPYFHDKSYAQNEAEVVRLANEAKARGANVDISKTLQDWRNDFKASAMSRNDIPPAVKEALVKQIEAGEGIMENTQTDESGVTDYAKEAEMYDRTATSVKEQLAPPKVDTTDNKTPEPTALEKYNQQKSSAELAIKALKGEYPARPKPTEYTPSQIDKMAKDSGENYYQFMGKYEKVQTQDGRTVYLNKDEMSKPKDIGKIDKEVTGERGKYIKFYEGKIREAEREIDKIGVQQKAKDELSKIDALIAQAEQSIEQGEDIPRGYWARISDSIRPALDATNLAALKSYAKLQINQGRFKEINPEVAKNIVRDIINGGDTGTLAMYGSVITPDPATFDVSAGFGFAGSSARELKGGEDRALENAFAEWRDQDVLNKAIESKDSVYLKRVLSERKALLESQLTTGQSAPRPADIAKTQQTQTAQAEEPSYTLTNQRNMSLGTTTTQVASSIESKRNDMKNFFTKKYGYVPASFEESFKAIYPEANFKTMETPYGVFMHDGKDWKQVQMQQVKPPSRKELAEEKAVSFGKLQPDSSIDINEFGELVPNSGVYVRGIFSGSPTDAVKFRQQMLEGSNAKKAVARLAEINDMVGESMPWNAKVWGEAKALLPQIKAGLRTDIIGVGTVSNYEQELINDVVANPTLFWSLESSDRAKIAVIMDKISNRLVQEPANYGLEVKVAGKSNAEMERTLRLGRAGKSKLELDFEARGGKTGMYSGGSTGAKLNWDLSNKIPDALK
jgi:hypothetical protein